jgi:hypothetical protein
MTEQEYRRFIDENFDIIVDITKHRIRYILNPKTNIGQLCADYHTTKGYLYVAFTRGEHNHIESSLFGIMEVVRRFYLKRYNTDIRIYSFTIDFIRQRYL